MKGFRKQSEKTQLSVEGVIPNIVRRITVQDKTDFSSFIVSIIFHAVVVIFLVVGLPSFKRDISTDYAVVIDVVPVSELTNVKVKESNRKDNVEQQTKKAPKSMNIAQNSPQEKLQSEKASKSSLDEKAEKVPDPNVKKEEKEKPKEQDESKKIQAQKNEQKKKGDDFARNIMKSIEEEQKKKNDKKIDKAFKEVAEALKGDTNQDYKPDLPMSISEVNAIKSQISRLWNTSAFSGAVDAGAMQVVIKISLDMDGNVLAVKPRIESNRSPYYRAFVESTVRAVKAASPLQHLNKDKYSTWKEIEFTFDASGMIY